MRKPGKRRVSLGTVFMLLYTVCAVAGFMLLMPSFTGNQTIFIDAARLAVAVDDSLTELSDQLIPMAELPQTTASATANAAAVYSTPAPAPAPTVAPKRSFTLAAAGSIEINADVQKTLAAGSTVHYEWLTDQMDNAIVADISLATLQNTVSQSQKASSVNLTVDALAALETMGINTLNIAHTNSLYYGENAFAETAIAVQEQNMLPIGMSSPQIVSVNGIRVAFLHYQDRHSAASRKLVSAEKRSELISPIDTDAITAEIASAKEVGVQVIIVTLNWGEDGQHTPTETQIAQAQAMADAGADIILGTGNGALQPVQVLTAQRGDNKYHPVLCAYSLGNLFSPERSTRDTLAGILLKTKVVYDTASQTVAFDSLTYTPTYAWRGKEDGKLFHRILINNPNQLPSFVDEAQKGVMERCLTLVNSVMADTAIPIGYE